MILPQLIISIIVAGISIAAATVRLAPPHMRTPLAVFNFFYILTSAIGATLIVDPDIRLGWMLLFPSMDAGWLSPGSSALYWFAVWGPLIVTNAVALASFERWRAPAVFFARLLSVRPDLLTCAVVGMALIAYCTINLAANGYLGVSLLSGNSAGDYRQNIIMRAQMMAVLGDTHYGLVYMGIPAICLVTLQRAVRTGAPSWWVLFSVLSLALSFLYTTTLTKGNLIVFGLALVIGGVTSKFLRFRGVVLAGTAGIVLLTFQESVLSGANPLEFIRTLSNVVLRVASGIPFYLEAFPTHLPFVGIDVGLSRFGIGPVDAPNLMVSNLMYPGDTWVQGAVPAPAHIASYAQGGVPWSAFTMVLVGALIGFAGAVRSVIHSPLAFSAFAGLCIAVYNTTQTDFVGVFAHSYGFKWWLAALGLVAVCQRILEFAMLTLAHIRPDAATTSRRGVAQS